MFCCCLCVYAYIIHVCYFLPPLYPPIIALYLAIHKNLKYVESDSFSMK